MGRDWRQEARGLLLKVLAITGTVGTGRAGLPSQNGSYFPEKTAWGKSEGLSVEDLRLTLKSLA